MKSHSSFIGLTASALVMLAGCQRDPAPDATKTTSSTVTTPVMSAPTVVAPPTPVPDMGGTGMGTTGTPAGSAGMAGNMAMTDAQLLQVTHFANAGEIAQAKIAKDKSKNADVKKLAQMMIDEHGDADKKGSALATKENLTLADSPTSTELKSTADGLTNDMSQKTGADFDKAYVDAQVKEHQAVLDTLDNKLIPTAKDADVKKYFQDVRKAVAMHLEHAKTLQGQLNK